MGAVNAKWLAVCRKGTRPQEQLSGLFGRRLGIGPALQPRHQVEHVRLFIASEACYPGAFGSQNLPGNNLPQSLLFLASRFFLGVGRT